MNRVFLSIGSNIDRERNLPVAIKLLRDRVKVVTSSAVYETAPSGTEDQPCFFNAALLIETELQPVEIKEQVISPVEQTLDRQRQADKNAPRTIDIDIALFNDEVLDYVPADGIARHIPDPDLLYSVHAIVPIAEIAADLPHPETGELLGKIAARLMEKYNGEKLIWLRKDILLE